MPLKDIKIGQKISIQREVDNNAEYASQVVDIIEEDKLKVLVPMHKSVFISLYKDSYIDIKYYIPNRGRYSFRAVVKERLSNNFDVIVQRVGEVKKVQERSHYRLQIELNLIKEYCSLESSELEIEKVITRDLSGNGMMVLCNQKHKLNEIVRCSIEHSDIDADVKGKIVRINELENSKYKYALGIEFVDIGRKTKEDIVKFIFKQQREMRKKGLI